jgi:predicted nucleic acid-binding protein
VSLIVLLDSAPLGLITNPRMSVEADECSRWLEATVARGLEVVIPEIADYEVRRELAPAEKWQGVSRLDALQGLLRYVPVTTAVFRKAAMFWALARQQGRKTADDAALDGDVILAAQAAVISTGGNESVVATTNVRHLGLFVRASHWRTI